MIRFLHTEGSSQRKFLHEFLSEYAKNGMNKKYVAKTGLSRLNLEQRIGCSKICSDDKKEIVFFYARQILDGCALLMTKSLDSVIFEHVISPGSLSDFLFMTSLP